MPFGQTCGKCGALRINNQVGLETVPDCQGWATGNSCGECFVCTMRAVARELWRVLRDDGTFWLNLGDKYATKTKNLIGIPWRVAFALQTDGWILRRDIIWSKPNPMPESVTDRPTGAHEYIFLFTKSQKYFYDDFAIREDAVSEWRSRDFIPKSKKDQASPSPTAATGASSSNRNVYAQEKKRAKRSVWTIPSSGPRSMVSEKEAHFAVFPPKLIRPCILAGTSAKGCCPKCGAPWLRILEKTRHKTRPGKDTKTKGKTPLEFGNRDPDPARHVTEVKMKGWKPGCRCYTKKELKRIKKGKSKLSRCLILDPFVGSGTSCIAADNCNVYYVGIDIDTKSVDLAKERLLKHRKVKIKNRYTDIF